MKDDTADCNAKGLSERAEKDECTCGDGDVFVWLTGLRCELERGEEDTGTHSHDNKVSDMLSDRSLGIEEGEETAGDEGDDPTCPNCRTESESDSHDNTCDGCGGCGGQGDGESVDPRLKSSVNHDGLELILVSCRKDVQIKLHNK